MIDNGPGMNNRHTPQRTTLDSHQLLTISYFHRATSNNHAILAPHSPFKAKSPRKAGSCLSIRQNMTCAISVHPPGREDVGVLDTCSSPCHAGAGKPWRVAAAAPACSISIYASSCP